LAVERWLLVWNFRVGVPMALHVPVVHQGEMSGLLQVAVEKGDPYFAELQRLWRTRHPTTRSAPATATAPAKVAQDFALHFPSDAAARGHAAAARH
jgi:predicted proteasome-type protease